MESFPTQLLVFPVIGPLCLGWENVLIQKVKILVFLMISYPLGHVTEAQTKCKDLHCCSRGSSAGGTHFA